jgi:hypothetical protein
MTETAEQQQINPLVSHFRQASIYIELPSKGEFWPEDTLNLTTTGELGIMSLTTKDEITLKTPDALLNGQSVVDVIQSCCPGIKNAWAAPSVDVDTILIAMRIASYGNDMEVSSECPHCKNEADQIVDLSNVLGTIKMPDYNKTTEVDGLTFHFKPQTYLEVNKYNKVRFEEQQIMRNLAAISDDADPEEVKLLINQQLANLANFNIELLSSSIKYIVTKSGDKVTDINFIKEYFENCDANSAKQLRLDIDEISKVAAIKPIDVVCLEDECKKPYTVNLEFDYASFFGQGS